MTSSKVFDVIIIFPHVFTCTYNYLAVGMSVLELGPIAFSGTAAIIAFFQGKGLLANNINCAQCGVAMVLSYRADISDGCRWRCPQCRKCVTIRKGSFFEKSRLSLQKWLLLMHWWAKEYPVTDAAQEIEVDESTAIQVYQWRGLEL